MADQSGWTARFRSGRRTDLPPARLDRRRLVRLLHRIRWEPEFGRGEFALGYFDRVLATEVVVPFSSVAFDGERPGTFTFTDQDEIVHHIPLHRVRTVYKDGAIIWSRGR
jgi:uncharacterized protein (UPF0248 family)